MERSDLKRVQFLSKLRYFGRVVEEYFQLLLITWLLLCHCSIYRNKGTMKLFLRKCQVEISMQMTVNPQQQPKQQRQQQQTFEGKLTRC